MKARTPECEGTTQHGDCPRTVTVRGILVLTCNCPCHIETEEMLIWQQKVS